MAPIDILLPTYNRLSSFIMTLTGVAMQTLRDLHLIVADQSQEPTGDSQVVQTLRRIIEARAGSVEWHRRPPIPGMTEQRAFLLNRPTGQNSTYLHEDVLMEPCAIEH